MSSVREICPTMMTSNWLLPVFLLITSFTGSLSFGPHQELPKKSPQSSLTSNDTLTLFENNDQYNKSTSLLDRAVSHIQRLLFRTAEKSETHSRQTLDQENINPVQRMQSVDPEDSSPSADDMQLLKRFPRKVKRFRRATSKFTGLVVGASRDSKLLQSITKTLTDVESSIWIHQSQYSKPFSVSKREPTVILGTFSSDFRTNFHGVNSEANLRRSSEYSLSDVNSLTTLLILQCLVEAVLYGSATAPAASNVSIGVESLKNFYTHTYPTGSSIVTMWPERLLADQKVWVSRPENIIGGQVKDNTTFRQLQMLAKSCNCEPAKSGLQTISENRLCEEHFSRPFSELFTDIANPPDFLTSFSNLALGSVLQFTFPGKKSGTYKAESQLWLSINNNIQTLINKLKKMAIIFPSALTNDTSTSINTSTTSLGKTAAHVMKREAINPNTTLDNTTNNSEDGKSSSTILDNTVSSSEAVNSNTLLDNGASKDGNISRTTVENSTLGSENGIGPGNTTRNSTASSEVNKSNFPLTEATQTGGANTQQADTEETVFPSSADLKANESLESTAAAAESINSPDQVSSNTTPSKESTPEEATPTNKSARDLQISSTSAAPASENSTGSTSPQSSVTSATTSVANITESVTNTAESTDVASNTTEAPADSTTTVTTDDSVTDEEEVRVNQILSSESYFAIRNYLDAVVPDTNEDVVLIPSLITDDVNVDAKEKAVAQNDGNVWHNGRQFHSYNKVDLLTTATVLHGVVVSAISGLVKIQEDKQLQDIVVSSLRLLTWFLNNPQEVVTVVTLSAFPSRYQLYWVTARVAFQLNSRQAQGSKLFQFADHVIPPFVKALREKMTFSILQSIIDGGLGQDGKTRVYIDDFLGVADLDDKGHKMVSGDDRVFTSAMAINTLIATWTVQKETGVLEFVKEIGDPVRIAINSLANYVSGAITDPANHILNAFMSEETKNCETLPARYPANIITSSDGRELTPSQPELNHRFGVKGYVSKVDYQNLLSKSTFGYSTRGGTLEDLNSPTSIFRFWSSIAYTKAVALLAIAQAANLEIDNS